jgi:hypothetical protein
MEIKYRKLMEEYNITLDNEVLDPGFRSKATDFEEKLKNNQLTDDEIKTWDAELIELFNAQPHEDVDSEELKDVKHEKDVADAKVAVAEAETNEVLIDLQNKFKETIPEVLPFITAKIDKLNKQAEKTDKAMKDQFIAEAKKEITAARYDDLQAMGEKYKEYPELVEIIKKRHADEKPAPAKTLKEILLSKKEWSYKELRGIGIEPTGNDMTVEGVRLEREYLLAVYSVRK